MCKYYLFKKYYLQVLIITPRDAIANCVNADKKRINEVEQLKDELTKGDSTKPRSRCCPYDFDPSLCKTVGDRLLCGYNRNIGGYQSDNEVELHNGCRIRGGRVECGYVNGPFMNPRRPPVIDNVLPMYDEDNTTPVNDINGSGAEDDNHKKEALKHVTSKNFREPTTRCLEIRERVVCRHL